MIRRVTLAVALLAWLPVFAGEPTPPAATAPALEGYTAADLAGSWTDNGHRVFEFVAEGASVRVVSVLNSATGPAFVVQSQGVEHGHVVFTYQVPASGYVISNEIVSVKDGVASYNLKGPMGSTTISMKRNPPATPAP